MKDINKIIDSLSPVEQNLMYNALQKKLNRGPEYTISYDKSGYYVKCDSPQLTAFRFEEDYSPLLNLFLKWQKTI